ncbi:MAG TPA: hypothetical protein VFQ90_00725 [Stellaceae bacterium]|jgi:hypothetical protein|nr:hypothetical protein [Stellaceae bacterium]
MTPAAIIEPCASDPTNPPPQLGIVVTIDGASSGVRPIAAATEAPYGVMVRAYPTQAPNATGYYGAQGFGPVVPWLAAGQPLKNVDVLRQGYILVPVNGQPKKGNPVHIWFAASAAPHVQGGFEAAATAGSTIELGGGTTFNGSPDANGIVEIAWNVGAVAVAATP